MKTIAALIGFVLASTTLPGWAADDPLLSLDTMRRATLGTFKGSFINCADQEGIELQLREVKGDDQSLSVEGTLKTSALRGNAGTPQIDAEVRGLQRADIGYVSLSPKPRQAAAKESAAANPIGFFKERLGIKDAPKAPPMAFDAGFIRDLEGNGFIGILVSDQFKCHAFKVARTDGGKTTGLPLPSTEFVMRQAGLQGKFIVEDPPFDGSATGYSPSRYALGGAFLDTPWLLYASQLGDPKALAYLGRMHEFGLGLPLDYAQAIAYYKQAAAHNNALAQLGLARLYMRGYGVERDPVQSKQFAAQYGATRLAALKVCTDSKILATVTQMIFAGMKAPPPMTLGNLLGAVLTQDKQIDAGTSFVYQKVAAVDLATIDAPFLCKYTVRTVDAKVTDMTPYREWIVRDPDGRTAYYNNRDEIEDQKAMAALTTVLANNMSVLEVFQVQALGGGRYRLARLQNGMTGALEPAATEEATANR